MKKISKRALSVFLSFLTVFLFSTVSYAQNESNENLTLSIISANVSGLPIPSMFSEDGKVVPKTQKIMGQMLNESGIDIICVQEDFQYHYNLAEKMTDYPYSTFTSGGVPVGDGLNIFSKYPIYNIHRVAWEVFNGILDAGNDALTPKGFLKCTADVNGVLVDIYDIHVDAYGSYEDCIAKKAQFIQLCKYIDENSQGRPVVITGDMNVTLHTDLPSEFYSTMIEKNGFSDGWTEYVNDGVYFTGALSQETIETYNNKYGYYWGNWDSVERLLYKDGDGLRFKISDFRYESYNNINGNGMLSDHNIMIGELELDTACYVRPDIELRSEIKPSAWYSFTHTVEMFARCIKLLLTDLISGLISGKISISN